jgi:hypothetical protein
MDGKKTRLALGEGVGEATRSHNLHSGGAGKWFLVSGPQLSGPALTEINTKYFTLWLFYVGTLFGLWMGRCNTETAWFCAELHLGDMQLMQFVSARVDSLFFFLFHGDGI